MGYTKFIFAQRNENGVDVNVLTLIVDSDRLVISKEVTMSDGVLCHEVQDYAFRTKREYTNAYRTLYWRIKGEGFEQIDRVNEYRPIQAWGYDADINIMIAAQNGTTPAK